MKKLWSYIGTAIFWLSWPAQWVYLRIGHRTRVLIVAEGEVLLIRGWIGSSEWNLPGGGLHHKEDYRVGAAREVYEELKIRLKPEALQELETTVVRQHGLSFNCTNYFVELPQKPPAKHRLLEITDSQWFAPRDALKEHLSVEASYALKTWSKKQNLL